MAYLLDTNVFIGAKQRYYGFQLCPGFWEWLIDANSRGLVLSHQQVLSELTSFGDDLATWAGRQRAGLFLPMDNETARAMQTVTSWVMRGQFRDFAKNEFLSGADPFVIACAMAHNHTVVTEEVFVQHTVRRVKIPEVCLGLNVPYRTTFQMLSQEGVVFVLR
jgi:Domain of unknown function (DUF4411)